MLADYLNIFQSIENQVTVILSCVLSPPICQDPSVLLLLFQKVIPLKKYSKDFNKSTISLVSWQLALSLPGI